MYCNTRSLVFLSPTIIVTTIRGKRITWKRERAHDDGTDDDAMTTECMYAILVLLPFSLFPKRIHFCSQWCSRDTDIEMCVLR